ncbi:optineurin isoform X1 [Ambystoma mexicanum]|uniref:optineurin isoform X1 n=1 Tax=Ambystoma mexicanum TaxID=8296 RepID=UPI0037E8EFF8
MSTQPVHHPAENGVSAENGKPLVGKMANGAPNVNSAAFGTVNPEEMLQQMQELITENYDLKAMKQNNQTMKDRYEELSTWREKQRTEREFYEFKFKEAKQRLLEVSAVYEKLKKDYEQLQLQKEGPLQGTDEGAVASRKALVEENEQMKRQVAKLQAEKKDLLSIISDLQLKLSSASSEDSFIEIRMSAEESAELNTSEDILSNDVATSMAQSMDDSRKEVGSEELRVSQLLRSLEEETQKVQRLESELQTSRERLQELEKSVQKVAEKETQTDVASKEEQKVQTKFESEVEPLKSRVRTLCEELQEAHGKLDEAELMKKRLQEKCQQLDRKVSELQPHCEEKRKLQFTVDKLELQVESMKSESKIEQSKIEHHMVEYETLQQAYKEQHSELDKATKTIQDLKMRESERVPREVVDELNEQLELTEKALAAKQLQIDDMKQKLFKQEEEMETIPLLRAQLDVYCADFHAERAAREKIHEEKENLAIKLEYAIKENAKLKEDLDHVGRQSIGELQMRHTSVRELSPHRVQRGMDDQPNSIPMHACPKCEMILPDMDTLQIHVMDCIT